MTLSTISADELKQRQQREPALELIDVRTPAEFGEIHVAFARNVPLDRLNPRDLFAGRGGNEGSPLYLICKTGKRAQMACEKILAAGFQNVVTVEGGTQACAQAGLPIVTGKKAISLERQVRIAAGSLVVLGVLSGWLVHPAGYGLAAFVGAGLMYAGITDTCMMGNLLAKLPWNQASCDNQTSCK